VDISFWSMYLQATCLPVYADGCVNQLSPVAPLYAGDTKLGVTLHRLYDGWLLLSHLFVILFAVLPGFSIVVGVMSPGRCLLEEQSSHHIVECLLCRSLVQEPRVDPVQYLRGWQTCSVPLASCKALQLYPFSEGYSKQTRPRNW
jgi:hypothetical protein